MFLDSIFFLLEKDEDFVRIKLANELHPIFQAHFPLHPILPAFVHLEIISKIFDVEITRIKRAKLVSFVLPSQELEYVKHENKYLVKYEGKLVASFIL